jgi:sugar phosphate isomerase/epimerase
MDNTVTYKDEIYLATVCLEPNRWGSRIGSIRVSEWLDRIREAGFDGIELWESHALDSTPEELEALRASGVPVKIFNTYASGNPDDAERRTKVLDLALALGAEGLKFNFGYLPGGLVSPGDLGPAWKFTREVAAIDEWLSSFPVGFRRLCELHPGASVSVDDLPAAVGVLGTMSSEVQAISHAFNVNSSSLQTHIDLLSDRLTHVHCQRICEDGVDGPAALHRLRAGGFEGSFCIEFTTGVGDADENINEVFENARRDMELLRGWLS